MKTYELNETTRSLIRFALFHAGYNYGTEPFGLPAAWETEPRNVKFHVRHYKSLRGWGNNMLVTINNQTVTVETGDEDYDGNIEYFPVETARLEDVIFYFIGEHGISDVTNINLI